MIKTLTKHGNSMALVIDRAVLDLLNIDNSTPLDISTDGEVLVVSPIHDQGHPEKIKASLGGVNSRYALALKRLAE